MPTTAKTAMGVLWTVFGAVYTLIEIANETALHMGPAFSQRAVDISYGHVGLLTGAGMLIVGIAFIWRAVED